LFAYEVWVSAICLLFALGDLSCLPQPQVLPILLHNAYYMCGIELEVLAILERVRG
jgi:hypothetical protein